MEIVAIAPRAAPMTTAPLEAMPIGARVGTAKRLARPAPTAVQEATTTVQRARPARAVQATAGRVPTSLPHQSSRSGQSPSVSSRAGRIVRRCSPICQRHSDRWLSAPCRAVSLPCDRRSKSRTRASKPRARKRSPQLVSFKWPSSSCRSCVLLNGSTGPMPQKPTSPNSRCPTYVRSWPHPKILWLLATKRHASSLLS